MRGLSLLPDEIMLFPEEIVKPYLGIGRRPHESGFTIIAYQLSVEDCPKYDVDLCTIYDERPTSCRQFPFSLDLDEDNEPMLGIDMNCPAAVEMMNSLDGALEFKDKPEAEKLLRLKQVVLKNPKRAWVYDLGKMKWVRFDKIG